MADWNKVRELLKEFEENTQSKMQMIFDDNIDLFSSDGDEGPESGDKDNYDLILNHTIDDINIEIFDFDLYDLAEELNKELNIPVNTIKEILTNDFDNCNVDDNDTFVIDFEIDTDLVINDLKKAMNKEAKMHKNHLKKISKKNRILTKIFKDYRRH